MRQIRRRTVLRLLPPTLAAAWLGSPRARAASSPIATPTAALGGLAATLAGPGVPVVVDRSLAFDTIRVGDRAPVSITKGIMLKGQVPARHRYLDDARNALKAAGNLRGVLAAEGVKSPEALRDTHKQWSRVFARKVLAWQRRLSAFAGKGHRLRDDHGRVYLLEWAGARVDPNAKRASPAALGTRPPDAKEPTLAAYEAHIEGLIEGLLRKPIA